MQEAEGENDPVVSLLLNEMVPVGEAPPSMVAVHEVEVPASNVAGRQAICVVVYAVFTVSEPVPELARFDESPPYLAVMVTGEPEAEVGVYSTEQDAPERVQVVEEKVPVAELDHVTVPVGEVPETTAFALTGSPTVTELEPSCTVVVEGAPGEVVEQPHAVEVMVTPGVAEVTENWTFADSDSDPGRRTLELELIENWICSEAPEVRYAVVNW